MEEAGFMTRTVASHQVAITALWLHLTHSTNPAAYGSHCFLKLDSVEYSGRKQQYKLSCFVLPHKRISEVWGRIFHKSCKFLFRQDVKLTFSLEQRGRELSWHFILHVEISTAATVGMFYRLEKNVFTKTIREIKHLIHHNKHFESLRFPVKVTATSSSTALRYEPHKLH